MSPPPTTTTTNCCVHSFFQDRIASTSFWRATVSIFFQNFKRFRTISARPIFRTLRSAYVTPPFHSLHWLPVEQRIEYKLSFLCPKSSLIRPLPMPISQTFFTFTRILLSCVLLQTSERTEYHLSVENPVVSVLCLTGLQLPGTNSLLLSVILPPSLLSTLP